MKYILFAFLAVTTFLFTVNASTQVNLPTEKPMIVGGELANKNDWPWMAALVLTYYDITTTLEVAGAKVESRPLAYSPTGQVVATMVDCGIGDSQCEMATGKICLIARGKVDFSTKVLNCQTGGGIGVIVYNNVPGDIEGTLGSTFSGSIPVLTISQNNGVMLLTQLDNIVNMLVEDPTTLLQSSNCGASFLGNRWVLTAAHCITDANIDYLQVNVGEYDLSNGADNAKAIKRIYTHPEYDEELGFNNDIALIELTETIEHPAISLLDYDESLSLALQNSPATVIGWGNTIGYSPGDELPANNLPDELRQVDLYLLSNEQCKEKLVQAYQTLDNITYSTDQVGITDGMVCAHSPSGGKGSCQGDSGGPLVVNTNLGWQQIGIVSYGVGCADAAFPDVFTRVSNFTDWINSITQGVDFEPNYDFPITPQYQAQTKRLSVTNNSQKTANLSFTIVSETDDNHGFSLTNDNCTTVLANEVCQIIVSFDALTLGQQKIQIVMTNHENIPTSPINISAQAVAETSSISSQLSNSTFGSQWFSGGDQIWLIDNTDTAIVSGPIDDDQHSSVLLTVSGEGVLSFDWAVSSQDNPSTVGNPFDALYLFIDGEQIDYISGEVAYTRVTIEDLTAGEHQIIWQYKKDNEISAGQDKAYLKNVVFTQTSSETQSEGKSSGGGLYICLTMLALACLSRRKF